MNDRENKQKSHHGNNDIPNLSEEDETKEQSALFLINQILSLLKISLNASTKLVTPAIQQLLQSIVPTLTHYYQQLAPVRIQEWLQIGTSALQNIFTILSQTEQGKEVLSQINDVNSNTIHLLTSLNVRQVIIEGVGVHVKAIEALSTPQMKTFLMSLPVFSIRVLDIVSSGEAKLLYHSMTNLAWNVIELLGRDETTLALAEVTALLVNALERERECRGPWNRKQVRRVRKNRVKVASLNRNNMAAAAASNARKRYERNRFIAQTYTDRVILKEKGTCSEDGSVYGDATVEDAILSSLGDGTRSDNAWLTALGRNDNGSHGVIDAASLPSRVMLPRIDSNADVSVGSIHLDDFDDQSQHKSLYAIDGDRDGNGEDRETVDISYLRDGIKLRRQKTERISNISALPSERGNSKYLSTMSIAGSSTGLSVECDDQIGIEDLILDEDSTSQTQKSAVKRHDFKPKGSKHLEHEDYSIDSDDQSSDDLDLDFSNGRVKIDPTRGLYSSSAHYYRTVEDFQTRLRDQTIAKELQNSKKDGDEEIPGVSVSQSGDKKWQSKAVAAAGAGNEMGQNVLRGKGSSMHSMPTRFRANVEQAEEKEEGLQLVIIRVAKKLIRGVPKRHKIVLGIIVGGSIFFIIVWFLLGCYGLYFLTQQVFSHGANQIMPSYGTSQTEFVLRIVQDPNLQNAANQQEIIAAAVEAIKDVVGGEL